MLYYLQCSNQWQSFQRFALKGSWETELRESYLKNMFYNHIFSTNSFALVTNINFIYDIASGSRVVDKANELAMFFRSPPPHLPPQPPHHILSQGIKIGKRQTLLRTKRHRHRHNHMLCFCSDKLFKVPHLFAHSENPALSFTFHLLWDTLSGALSIQLLRSESINRRWWSNPNREQRLNVFVARFARGGRYYSRAGDKWRMHYSEHTTTQTIFLHNQNSSSRNTRKLLLQF